MTDETVYGEAYFRYYSGRPYARDGYWLPFFGGIADHIVQKIGPKDMLDAGCALGLLVEACRDRGVNAQGIDLSTYAIEHVYEPIRPFCRQGSIAQEFPARYDLIVSIEVLEHLPARDGEAAIANFCRHTDDVLFSSTPGHFHEPSHVNVQPAEYWAELFALHGFYRDVDFDASFITPWAVRFRRSGEPLPRLVRHYERAYRALNAERLELRTAATELNHNLAAATTRLAELEPQSAALQAEVAHLKAVVADMERSIFWRIRRWLGRS